MERLKMIPGGTGPAWPVVLSIAGLDPSGGAGLLADVKTFEAQGVYGLAINTANTLQTDRAFFEINWSQTRFLTTSIKSLAERFDIAAVKIGVLPSLCALEEVAAALHQYLPAKPVVWDPVMKATTGVAFFEGRRGHGERSAAEKERWRRVLAGFQLITPNRPEADMLAFMLLDQAPDGPGAAAGEILRTTGCVQANNVADKQELAMQELVRHAGLPVLLKGGHLINEKGKDLLIMPVDNKKTLPKGRCNSRHQKNEVIVHVLSPDTQPDAGSCHAPQNFEKHGTGCVLSAAIVSRLAHGDDLLQACTAAKSYVSTFLFSNSGLLGLHASNKDRSACYPLIY